MSVNLIFCLECESNSVDVNRQEEEGPIFRCSVCGNEDQNRFTIGRAYLPKIEDETIIIEEAREDMAIKRRAKLTSSGINVNLINKISTPSPHLPSKKGVIKSA